MNAPRPDETGLQHGLKQRHMTMIALGGVIGAGLFVGSSVVIKEAGPAQLLRFWLPGMPLWIGSLGIMFLLTLSNLMSVRSYGETEFWFASVKVAAIVVFLFLGALFVLGLWPTATPGLANLVAHGGFAPNGILPVLSGAVAATGFYFGAEVVTVAAAEATEPAKAIARATSSVITRVLIFYIGSIFLVVAIVPWNSHEIATPYVSALKAIGVPAAAQIMNAVILTAVLSALNSGLYVSSRMLFALTRTGDAPRSLAKLNRKGVPVRAILLGTLFGYGAVIMSYISPDRVFAFLVDSYGTVALFVYLLIAVAELRLRRRLERDNPAALVAKMWAFPALTYATIAGMVAILAAMALIPDQRMPLLLGFASLGVMLAVYGVRALRLGSRPTV